MVSAESKPPRTAMGEMSLLAVLSVAMFVGAFAAGYVPLLFNLHASRLVLRRACSRSSCLRQPGCK